MVADVCTFVQVPRLRPDHEEFIRKKGGSNGDIIILEFIYGLPSDFLTSISQTYIPIVQEHCNQFWREWEGTEKYLIAARPEHQGEVRSEEIAADRDVELLRPRFDVWYTLSYPRKVKRVDEEMPRREGLVPRLRPDHEAIITTESSKRLLEVTYSSPDECLEAVYKTYSYRRERMKQYNALQAKWLGRERDLIAKRPENQRVFVDDTQLTNQQLEDMDQEKLRQRFRLYYMLRYPYNIRRLKDIPD
jgi:hypothetical protein